MFSFSKSLKPATLLWLCIWFLTSAYLCAARSPDADSKISIPLEKARMAYEAKRWDEVIDAATSLFNVAPEHLEGHYMLAIAEIRLGLNEGAVKRLTWLNSKVPDNAGYRCSLAEALMAAGLVKQAVTQAEYAVQLAPEKALYKNFLEKISTVTRPASQPANLPDPQPVERSISEFELRIIAIASECEKLPETELARILEAVTRTPELMSDLSWSVLQKRLDKTRASLHEEVIRQFILWKAGEISLDDYSRILKGTKVKTLDWKNNSSLQTISEHLCKNGIAPISNQQTCEPGDATLSWFESLDSKVKEAFFDARYDDAWNLHLGAVNSGSNRLWAYQSARLALELWQLHNFKDSWLEIARTHLDNSMGKGYWQEDAKIIQDEIASRLEGKSGK